MSYFYDFGVEVCMLVFGQIAEVSFLLSFFPSSKLKAQGSRLKAQSSKLKN